MLLERGKWAVRLMILVALLALAAGTFAMAQKAWAADADDAVYPATGGNLYFDKNTQMITDADPGITAAEIPAEIQGLAVRGLEDFVFEECENLTTVTFAGSIISIGEWAFADTALKSVIIPASVTDIGEYAFDGCTKLTEINVDELNRYYSSIDGVLFNAAKTTLIQYPAGKTDSSYTIPAGVDMIGSNAFRNAQRLTGVTIPAGVEDIGYLAFYGCTNLKEVILPKSVTYIGDEAFGYDSDDEHIAGFTIRGASDAAERYANYEGFNFIWTGPKESQTVNCKSVTKTYGDKAFSLKATAKTTLSYTSGNPGVVTVNKNGLVTVKGTGKATVTIKAAATTRYNAAAKKVTVTVKPGQVADLRVKAGKKQATVTWKKNAKASGYQVMTAQDNKFTKGKKIVNISNNKTIKATVKKLKSKKTYYVKVRAYKTVGKTKIYGAYTKAKKVKVK